MMLGVPKTLEEAIAKLVEIVAYLEEEEARRSEWEAEVADDLEDMENRLTALGTDRDDLEDRVDGIESRISQADV